MKKKFSKSWIGSKQPRKQRKYLANAPLHIKRKFLAVNLNKELRKRYNKKSVVVRKDDVVKILRGKFKKKQGKVLEVKTKQLKVTVEGIQVKKIDGSKVNFPLKTSNLQIVELGTEDRKRLKSIGIKQGEEKKKENLEKKTGEK